MSSPSDCVAVARRPAPGESMHALRALARSIGAWIGAHRRSVRDRDALVRMSDRELRDIGIVACTSSDRTHMRNYLF